MSDFHLFDIGSRGMVPARWHKLSDENIRITGFEPDIEECERLNHSALSTIFTTEIHHPLAVSEVNGFRDFWVTKDRALCSFHKPNELIFRNYQGKPDRADIVRIESIPTITLNKFCEEIGIQPHFIKIDTQGTEYSILKNYEGLKNVLGLEVELLVLPLYEGMFTNFTLCQRYLETWRFRPWWIEPVYWQSLQGNYRRLAWFNALYINERFLNHELMPIIYKAYAEEIGYE